MLRNRFFSRATEYYLKGDVAKAKLYSMEAKHYNRLMQEMHMEASKRIFESRSQHEAFIDLHGLHEDEALDMIEQRLHDLKQSYHGIIYIVTGTGHHSGANGISKKESKLKPSVYNYLRQENYRFAETSIVGDSRGGVFAVLVNQ
jgi:DNA-nicking Smr family endonuclease